MTRFLFVFDWTSTNDVHLEFGSWNAVWVSAPMREITLAKGREYAERFLQKHERATRNPEYKCWIEDEPMKEFSGLALESFEVIDASC